MALIRCPHCEAPMTDEEAAADSCPMCGRPLHQQQAVEALAPTAGARPQAYTPSSLLPWAAGSFLCLALLTYLIYSQIPRAAQQAAAESEPAPPARTTTAAARLGATTASAAKTQTTEHKQPTPAPREAGSVQPFAKPYQGDESILPIPFLASHIIKIDGDLADWKDLPAVLLSPVKHGESTRPIAQAPPHLQAHLAYDLRGLLIAVDVADTSGALEKEGQPAFGDWPFWTNDAVEVYLETRNTRVRERGEASAHQLIAFPFGTFGDSNVGGYELQVLRDKEGRRSATMVQHTGAGGAGFLRGARKTPLGWQVEMLIPYSLLRMAECKQGDILGLELQIDTGTNLYYRWACHSSAIDACQRPSCWGQVVLAGSDARIELLTAAQDAATAVVPGEPLTVRVTDPDVIFAPAGQEPLSVTVRTSSGAEKKLVLQPTARYSGVYVATLTTQATDSVSVEYLDRLRANGERNVPVRANLRAGALSVQSRR